jgi:hypothetical protein
LSKSAEPEAFVQNFAAFFADFTTFGIMARAFFGATVSREDTEMAERDNMLVDAMIIKAE